MRYRQRLHYTGPVTGAIHPNTRGAFQHSTERSIINVHDELKLLQHVVARKPKRLGKGAVCGDVGKSEHAGG